MKQLDRRSLIARVSALMGVGGAAAVGGLVGCAPEAPPERRRNPTDNSRVKADGDSDGDNNNSDQEAGGGGGSQTEPNSTLYSADDPGPWAGKEGSHIPTISLVDGNKLLLVTDHPIAPDHYISRQQVLAEDGTVLADKVYNADDLEPVAEFTITPNLPAGETIRIISTCNLHDTWYADVEVGPLLAGFTQDINYTSEQPGPWAGKEAGHLPVLAAVWVDALEVSTDHPQSAEHYISKHSVLDENFNLLTEATFQATEDPVSSLTPQLPPTGANFHIVSECNKHGKWMTTELVDNYLAAFRDTKLYTAADQGRFVGKDAGHLPVVALVGGALQITTTHEMIEVHYIQRQQIIAENGEILFDKLFSPDPLLTAAVSLANPTLPQGTTFKVRSTCNCHQTWEATFDIALFAAGFALPAG